MKIWEVTLNSKNWFDVYFQEYSAQFFGKEFDWLWIKAQAMAESRLDPGALSPVGAMGVMQLMPGTASDMAKKLGLGVAKPWVPHLNIMMGVAYLHHCWGIWKKEEGIERLRFAFGSYNGGIGDILGAQELASQRGLRTDTWEAICQVLPDVPKAKAEETIPYVARIERYLKELHSKK